MNPRLPRNISGKQLVNSLKVLGYEPTRQSGSHIRITTQKNGVHNMTIPDHDSLRVGTLSKILNDLSAHHNLSRNDLLKILDL
jgi:predicted RNA binding protein YcfA (HicA-like mRNA interferase family)